MGPNPIKDSLKGGTVLWPVWRIHKGSIKVEWNISKDGQIDVHHSDVGSM